VVVATPFEGRIFASALGGPACGAGARFHIIVAGMGAPADACRRLSRAEGYDGVLSFGFAGALDPALPSGTCLLPAHVRGPDGETRPADAAWHATVCRELTGAAAGAGGPVAAAVTAPLLTLDYAAGTGAAKRALAATGAAAVDMESLVLARQAARAGLPFLVLRAVADSAKQDLPQPLLGAGSGAAAVRGLIAASLTAPRATAALLVCVSRARRTLIRAARGAARPLACAGVER